VDVQIGKYFRGRSPTTVWEHFSHLKIIDVKYVEMGLSHINLYKIKLKTKNTRKVLAQFLWLMYEKRLINWQKEG